MKKKNYWFRLDCDFLNDAKVEDIFYEKGNDAVVAYLAAVSKLYLEGGRFQRARYNQIAHQAHTTVEVVKYVVEESGLFVYDDTDFWSERASKELDTQRKISENRAEAGRQGAAQRQANAQQMLSKQEANVKQTGSKCLANANDLLKQTDSKQEANYQLPITNNQLPVIDINNSSLHSELPPTFSELESQDDSVLKENDALIEKRLSDAQCKEVIALWNNIVKRTKATFSLVTAFSKERKNQIRIRWREFEKIGNPWQVCQVIFEKACSSNFLQGEGGKGWKANFDWIFRNGKNWPKIYEGSYDNNTPKPGPIGFAERTINGLQEIHNFFNPENNGITENTIPDDQPQW